MILPCGHQAEDDGDRYYADECFVPGCGWMSEYRRSRHHATRTHLQRLAEEVTSERDLIVDGTPVIEHDSHNA